MKPRLRPTWWPSRQTSARPEPDLPRVIPPVWASDDDLALLRKAGLL